jgi:hypothetical protein
MRCNLRIRFIFSILADWRLCGCARQEAVYAGGCAECVPKTKINWDWLSQVAALVKPRNGADRLRTEMIFNTSPTLWVFNPAPSATLAAPPTTLQQASEPCKCRPLDMQRPPATAIVRRCPQETVTVRCVSSAARQM